MNPFQRIGVSLAIGAGVVASAYGGEDCAGGIVHDDGTVDQANGFSSFVDTGIYLDRFYPPEYPYTFTKTCVCWISSSQESEMGYEVVFFDDDGGAGMPGTFLGSVPAIAEGVSGFDGDTPSFYQADVSSANVVFPQPVSISA